MGLTGLQGKVVLVTGGNHGIGAATAQAFARAGARVLINYLRIAPPEGAEQQTEHNTTPGQDFYYQQRTQSAEAVVQSIREAGGEAEAIEANLADPATIPLLFEQAESIFGSVDILINNADHCEQDTFIPVLGKDTAAIAPDGFPSTPFTIELHDKHFAVNSRAVALMIKEFASRHVQKQKSWGRIINLSTDGAPGFAGEISYGASKAALESYSRAAAKELGQYGITVNIVSPGPIQTGWITPEMEREIAEHTPLKRLGQPDDLADVILFLASDGARWLTGQWLSVSGGMRMF